MATTEKFDHLLTEELTRVFKYTNVLYDLF